MPPRNPKSSSTQAAVDDSRKTADALWLFEQFLNCDPPVSLNVTPISEKTGMKPNTIVKRINTMQHRYPGFGIVTRTIGPRQSSNLKPATPKASTDSPVEKSAVKGINRGNRSKELEIVEEDDEDSNKRQTRAKKRGERGVSDTKTEADQGGNQTQVHTTNNSTNQPSKKPANKRSKETKSQKITSKELLPVSDDDAEDPVKTDTEDEATTKKAATPKTRGGQRSAGIGEIKDMHTYPERPAPRGRHAVARKDKVSDRNVVQVGTVEASIEDSGKNDPDDLPNCTKRKRSEAPESQSSPLTPSPDIRRKLVEMGCVKQPGTNGSNKNQSDPSDMSPLSKKQKTNDNPGGGDDIDAEVVIEEICSSDTPGIRQPQPVVTTNQEDTSTEVEHFQSCNTETSDADPETAVEPEQPADKIVTTPAGQHIDERLSPSDASNCSSEHAAGDGQVIEPPESPTAGRGRSLKPAAEAGTKTAAAPTLKATASGITTVRQEVVRGNEPFLNPVGSDAERASSSGPPDDRRCITAVGTKVQEIARWLTKTETPNSRRDLEPSQSIECEWMIYNPTTKLSKAK